MSGTFPSTMIAQEIQYSEHNTLRSESQSMNVQTRARAGHRWKFDVTTCQLSTSDWRDLQGFIVAQRGMYDSFTYTPYLWSTPRGAATSSSSPLVDGASQTGRSLVSDGWPASAVILKRGDVFKLTAAKVYMITSSSITATSSGAATLAFEPALVTSPADNSAITITNVPVNVGLVNNLQQIGVDVATFGQATITLEERST